MSTFGRINFDWERSVYGNAKELIPHDIPEPRGKHITMMTFVDANLMHDVVTGKAVTGILHFLNMTPIDWYTKKQNTVETATYGSEFVVARTATEQIIDLRLTLRYLGANIREVAYLFGDNESVAGPRVVAEKPSAVPIVIWLRFRADTAIACITNIGSECHI